MSQTIPASVLGQLREGVARMKQGREYKEIIESQAVVQARFQPVFAPEHVTQITEDEFRPFLHFEHNRHWTGLYRQGSRLFSDMDKLRQALAIVVDESRPITSRFEEPISMIKGMGQNIVSGILLICHPDKYGVWNSRSEGVMKRMGIWPKFDRGESYGSRYAKVNAILLQLCDNLQIDLWTLDTLWWFLDEQDDKVTRSELKLDEVNDNQRFGLERQLHNFMFDNWNRIELSQEWKLFQDQGNEDAGYEYPCDVGYIDLLAQHRTEPRWLVIELKRNQTSDQTVGQLLRYMGWVKQHLAEDAETVHGLIICREADDKLLYALSAVQNVELRLYEVDFHLRVPETMLRTNGTNHK